MMLQALSCNEIGTEWYVGRRRAERRAEGKKKECSRETFRYWIRKYLVMRQQTNKTERCLP